jgi:hypothetical protein
MEKTDSELRGTKQPIPRRKKPVLQRDKIITGLITRMFNSKITIKNEKPNLCFSNLSFSGRL